MRYLFIDTNIYVQCCLLELEGDDINALTKLHRLLDSKKITLLLPEVVELEFYKVLEEKTGELKKKVGSYKESINKDASLDKKIKNDLISKLDECIKEREKNKEKVKKEIGEIFRSDVGVIKKELHIKPDNIVNAYKLFLAGKKPSKLNRGEIQADCLIVEILADYFKGKDNYELFFCGRDKADFTVNSGTDNKMLKIHPDISKKFKHIEYHANLFQLLNDKFKAEYSKKSIEKLEEKTPELYIHSPSVFNDMNMSCVDFHHSNPHLGNNSIRGVLGNSDIHILGTSKKNSAFTLSGEEIQVGDSFHISNKQTSYFCKRCKKSYDASIRLIDNGLCDDCSKTFFFTGNVAG
jgi:hypothetical protein